MDAVNHDVKVVLEEKIAHCRKKLAFAEKIGPTTQTTIRWCRAELMMYKLMLQMEDELRKMRL